ncbi:hypothetical protein KK007_04290 [Enterobacter hormaechei subsp. xiangfangensis]|nr:hypothetical protein [Enterobacter hormaechei subsp. xiangfangensis]
MCINVETMYKETEARMGDVTLVFIPEEGRKRGVTKSLILLWRFIPITQFGRKGMKEYYIVAFYGTSSLSDVSERPQAIPNFNPPLSTFRNHCQAKCMPLVYLFTFI